MIKVTRFLTEDGEFFENEKEAAEHEKMLRFRDWYDSNELYFEGDYIPFEYFSEWLKNNSKHITLIFNEVKQCTTE